MDDIKTRGTAYHFPTKESLMQFIAKYGDNIIDTKLMEGCYGFAGCDTYSFRCSKDYYFKYEWGYCKKVIMKRLAIKSLCMRHNAQSR